MRFLVGYCALAAFGAYACSESSPPPTPDAGATDGGPAFVAVPIPGLADPQPNFFGVFGTSTEDIFLVGERGTIVHWDGTAWSQQGTPAGTRDLRDVWGRKSTPDLPAADEAWAVGAGGALLRYAQGVWTTDLSTTTEDLHAVAGNSRRVWAVGTNGLITTKDISAPDRRWVIQRAPTLEVLNDIWVGDGQAVAVGNLGMILKNDGTSWTRASLTGITAPLQGIFGVAADRLWIVGLDGTLLKSSGTSFQEVAGAPRVYLRRITGLEFENVWFTGWGGTIGNVQGTKVSAFQQFTDHRLEGIWATTRQVLIDPEDPAAGTVDRPEVYIVGVTGMVLRGP